MNASNLARGLQSRHKLAARVLDQAAAALDARAVRLRSEARRIRESPRDAVGAEQGKVSMLVSVKSLTDAVADITTQADHLAASANDPEMGVSSRMLAAALGVSTNTAIKRIRKVSEEGI